MPSEHNADLVAAGLTAFNEGRYADAADAWTQAIQTDPTNALAHWNLGLLLVYSANWTAAADIWANHVAISPGNGQGWHYYATALHRLNRPAEAVPAYRRALEIDPSFAAAKTGLAEAQAQLRAVGVRDRLLILDPGLVSKVGHHYNYDLMMLRAADRYGVAAQLHCLKTTSPEIVAELAAQPRFRSSTYDFNMIERGGGMYPNGMRVAMQQNFIITNRQTYEDLSTLTGEITADDVLFFHSVMENHLLGLAQWLEALPPVQRPRTVVQLQFWSEHTAEITEPLYRLALSALIHPALRVRLCSVSVEMCTIFSRFAGRPIDLVRIPNLSPVPAAESFLPAGHRGPVIGFIGDARGEKGFAFLSELIRRLRAAGAEFHMLIQISHYAFTPDIVQELQNLIDLGGTDITLVRETLSEDRYLALIRDCNIVLQPYNPDIYRYFPSGVFIEAVCAGKVMVVPDRSCLSHDAERLGAGYCAFRHYAVDSIWQALLGAVQRYAELAPQAAAAGIRARAAHHPDHLLDYLFEQPA